MADVFIEHLVKKKNTTASSLQRVLYVAAYLLLCLATLMIEQISFVLPLIVVGGIWLLVYLMRQLFVEYEYVLTNGELDIDKITGQRKRKRQLTVDCRNFEVFAPMDKEHFGQYENTTFVKRLDASSGPGNPGRYFAITNAKEGGRLLLILEPDERMLTAINNFVRKTYY